MTTRTLIISDDLGLQERLELTNAARECEFRSATSAEAALDQLEAGGIELVIARANLPGCEGGDLLRQVCQRAPEVAIIAVVERDDPELAQSALERGAYDWIALPISSRSIEPVLGRARERIALRRRNALLYRDLVRASGDRPIVASSEPMIELLEGIEHASASRSGVLFVGEAGTGKETLARAIHAQSPRRGHTFLAISCQGSDANEIERELFGREPAGVMHPGMTRIRRGLLADSDGGSLFLDEVGALPLAVQTEILRVLEEESFRFAGEDKQHPIDVRLIATTSIDLDEEVAAGRFLPTLLHRLRVHALEVPPLRERRNDIPLLFDHFLAQYRRAFGKSVRSISDDALEILVRYRWPGNARELENVVEALVLRAEGIRIIASDLPDHLSSTSEDGNAPRGFALKPARKAAEADLIRRALRATNGNRTHAARLLEISHRALLYKLKEYSIRDLPAK